MEKKIKIKNIRNIIKNSFSEDIDLPASKIDSIIKEYLFEREEIMDDESFFGDEYDFSPKTVEALTDMVDGLSEMLGDLDVIKEKEGNVLVLQDVYADEYINNITKTLEDIIDDLKHLSELNGKDTIDDETDTEIY
jgi:hypothetical protein